jgi:hypothetical protein
LAKSRTPKMSHCEGFGALPYPRRAPRRNAHSIGDAEGCEFSLAPPTSNATGSSQA